MPDAVLHSSRQREKGKTLPQLRPSIPTHPPSSFRDHTSLLPFPHPLTHPLSLLQATAGANCPYSTLGVGANASENEIKQAYRKLVLQYHPDVNHANGAERRFMSIQHAYELLTGKSRGGADGRSGHRGDWDFHDW